MLLDALALLAAACGGTEPESTADARDVQEAASIVILDCTVFEGHACAPPRSRQGCYHNQSGQQIPGLCICSAEGTWSCG